MKNALLVGLLVLAFSATSLAMFEAILSHFESELKDNQLINFDELKVKRFNRTTFVLAGNVELNVDSIDDWDALCTSYRKMGNEYKLLPYKVGPSNACKMLKEEKLFWPEVIAVSENLPAVGTCDFKRGTITVNDYLPELNKLPPVFESGDYMIHCQILWNEERIQGFKIYGQVYNIQSAKSPKPGAG